MSEEVNKATNDPAAAGNGAVSVKSQLGALLILVPILGAIWFLFQYLPAVGDWVGAKTGEVIEGDGVAPPPVDPSTEPVAESVEPELVEEKSALPAKAGNLDSFRRQIVEQLSDHGIVEVRHLALSEDKVRMVAALQISTGGEDSELVEVFFDRDEFGRYLSAANSPLDASITLWSE